MGHYVYKYVLDDEIVYIGKNDTDLHSRIYQHTLEDKFQPVKDAQIYYIELQNSVESRVMEELLINKYKPVLNIVSKQRGLSISFEEPPWREYAAPKKPKKKQKPKTGSVGIKTLWDSLPRNKQDFLKRCVSCERISFKTISELAGIDNNLYDIKFFLQEIYDISVEKISGETVGIFHLVEEVSVFQAKEFVVVELSEQARRWIDYYILME